MSDLEPRSTEPLLVPSGASYFREVFLTKALALFESLATLPLIPTDGDLPDWILPSPSALGTSGFS